MVRDKVRPLRRIPYNSNPYPLPTILFYAHYHAHHSLAFALDLIHRPSTYPSGVTVSIASLIPSRSGWWLTVIIPQSTLQRDNSQIFSAGRSIGHTANSRNPTARNIMSNSGNTRVVCSVADCRCRTYNDGNHNEFNHSSFHGPVTFNYPSPTGISKKKKLVQTREAIENLSRYFIGRR